MANEERDPGTRSLLNCVLGLLSIILFNQHNTPLWVQQGSLSINLLWI